jgi:hypothetical protein
MAVQYRIDPSRLRLSGSVLRDVRVEVVEDGVVVLLAEGEPLATWRSMTEMMTALSLTSDDLEPINGQFATV